MVAGNGPQATIALDARLVGGDRTGDSTYWTALVQAFRTLAPPFRFLLYSNAPRPAGFPADSPGFQWRTVPGASRWWSWVRFPLAARREGADLVHVQYSLSPLVRRGVTTVHDISFLIGPEWFPPGDRAVLSRTVPAACRRARRIITVSETSRGEIERFIPAARGKVVGIPNAPAPWVSPVGAEEARAMAARHGLDGPYVLTVGTRWPRKNMGLAVAAVDGLDASLPHLLAVTGKAGWGDQELGARGHATGYVPNEALGALYAAASAYLAPSRHEGFGIPVLEAMRCGCPVIASSGGALPEVVGDAGVVVPSWDAADWTAALQELLTAPSKLAELRRRGLERAAGFTWDETARRTLAVYEEALR